MGTDCTAIAKFRNNTYKTHSLHRYYVFNRDLKDHPPLVESSGIIYEEHEEKDKGQKFDINKGCEWCVRRGFILSKITEEEWNQSCLSGKPGYHSNFVNQLLEFLVAVNNYSVIYELEIEWVGVFSEHDKTYEEITFYTEPTLIEEI
jgi:hypothetical protein